MDKVMILFLWVYLFLIFQNPVDGVSSRIVGGLPAPPGSAPYHVSLQNIKGDNVCGGAVITDNAILSVAHCFIGVFPDNITAVLGTEKLSDVGERYKISKIISHENYDPVTKENDIAILITVSKIAFSKRVHKISLMKTFISQSDNLSFIGLGLVNISGENPTDLQIIELKLLEFSTCRYAYRNIRQLFDSQMCTFNRKGEGTCKGDSGSPLIMDSALVGMASFGIPCAIGYPDVFTRITSFIPWIKIHAPDI